MLSNRMMVILKELIAVQSAITGKELASTLNVTSRTIRDDIKALNEILAKQGGMIQSRRGVGYELVVSNQELFKTFLLKLEQSKTTLGKEVPHTPEERTQFIIRKLLLAEGYMKSEDIAEELYISKSTLQNDLMAVRKILREFGLEIESRPYYGIQVVGDEQNLRYCLSEYLFNREDIAIYLQKQIDSIIPKEEFDAIHSIILDAVKKYDIEISDIGINNLSIHLAIACKRIREGNYISLPSEDLEQLYIHQEHRVAQQIVKKIEKALYVSFPKTEIAYVTIHLLGTKKAVEFNVDKQPVDSFFDRELVQTIREMIQKVDQTFNLQLEHDQELIVALGLHLQPTINRLRYGMNLRNPMLHDIKVNYPLAFDAAVLACEVLKEKVAVEIDENEIGYIALHFGAAMFRNTAPKDMKRCLIVCSSGVGSAMLLKCKLQNKYKDELHIENVIDYHRLNESLLKNIDFIITTIPLQQDIPVPIVYVNAILTEEDMRKIERLLRDERKNELPYVKKEHIFLKKNLQTKEEVIHFLVDQLEKDQYVDESFRQSVLDREQVSATSFGNLVAIPHPITPLTDETFWAICTLQNPIKWGSRDVQFVCLLSVGKNETEDLKAMYEFLINLIENRKKVTQLIQCEDHQTFINLLIQK